jgi:endonuclease-3 related protein
MNKVEEIYYTLLKIYKKQGWWPIFNAERGISEYGVNAPRSEADIFEIIIGAILTQNVAWKNVETALENLKKKRLLFPQKLHKTEDNIIASCIRASGYYNQKTKKIKNFLDWFGAVNYSFDKLKNIKTDALRATLLGINGIGYETADSILLYGLNRKIFVVDAYTKRIFSRLNLISSSENYSSVQNFFHREFPGTLKRYNEYHALIVAHGKDICKKTPLCNICKLNNLCAYTK